MCIYIGLFYFLEDFCLHHWNLQIPSYRECLTCHIKVVSFPKAGFVYLNILRSIFNMLILCIPCEKAAIPCNSEDWGLYLNQSKSSRVSQGSQGGRGCAFSAGVSLWVPWCFLNPWLWRIFVNWSKFVLLSHYLLYLCLFCHGIFQIKFILAGFFLTFAFFIYFLHVVPYLVKFSKIFSLFQSLYILNSCRVIYLFMYSVKNCCIFSHFNMYSNCIKKF